MIEHLERIVHRLLELVGGWMCALAMVVVLALAASAFLCLNLYKFDRNSCLNTLYRVRWALTRGWGWMLTAALLLLQVYALCELRSGLQERFVEQGRSRYVAGDDSGGLPTTQRAPQVSFLETTSHSQRIVIPSQVSSIASLPGWNPEEARYGGNPALNVEDQLVHEDKAVVLNRTYSVQRYVPMKLQKSDVDLELKFFDKSQCGCGLIYSAQFQGRYTFQNPFPDARRIHFSFPLPDNSGTMAGFHFLVNDQEVPAQDVDRGLDWEGEVKPQESVVVEIRYQHLGAKAWSYDVTGRREPIADFHLRVRADKPDLKFQRGSLYPSKVESGEWRWDLENQITSQSISLYFPHVPSQQIVGHLFVFAPFSLMLLMALTVVWSGLRRHRVGPWRTSLSCLAGCGGYALVSYLVSYLPLAASLLLAFALVVYLQRKALGSSHRLPIGAAAVAPFTFLWPGNTGLLLTLLGMAILARAIHETVSPAGLESSESKAEG